MNIGDRYILNIVKFEKVNISKNVSPGTGISEG